MSIETKIQPEVGKTYKLHHCRFGNAVVKILSIGGEWADTLIVSGELKGINDTWFQGDEKTVRIEHCIFTEVVA